MDPDRRYFFPVVGYNYRLTNVASAILCGQLEHWEAMLEARRAVVRTYDEELRGVDGLGMQPVATWASPTPWLFSMTVDRDRFGASRDELMKHLAGRGVETRPFFVPLHTLPPYVAGARQQNAELPTTDRLAASGLNLPTHSRLPLETVHQIAEAVREMPR
jgi:perosamine synthetase